MTTPAGATLREEKRLAVMKSLRELRGTARRSDQDGTSEHAQSEKTRYSAQFFHLRKAVEAEEDGDTARDEITDEHVQELLQAVRAIRHEREPHPLQASDDDDMPVLSPERRRQLLAEIATEQFKNNMHEWLNSVEADHELGETPLKELERLKCDAEFRQKVFKALLQTNEREIDVIELHIRAHRVKQDIRDDSTPDS